jgi:type II secretory pathway component PulJ
MVQPADNVSRTSPTPRAVVARGGFTLIELLVASAGGLILMGFVAVVFGFYGRTVRENQAIIRMNDSLRSAAWKLRQDLQGITCDVKPWIRPEQDAGYFELIEGPLTDSTYYDASGAIVSRQPSDPDPTNLIADYDDILLFTTRGNGAGFIGKHNTSTIEADAAEVAWFCVQQPGPPVDGMNLYSLHRRQLLVVGYVGTLGGEGFFRPAGDGLLTNSGTNPQTIPTVFQEYDISLRQEGTVLVANGLSDLTKRENRFLHRYLPAPGYNIPLVNQTVVDTIFPYVLDPVRLVNDAVFTGDRAGEDVVIRNVLAFDVRVFDPAASPPGYIDLGYLGNSGNTALEKSGNFTTPTYCTWSYHYEFNGLSENQDNAGATDSIDNDGDGQVDEAGENLVDEGTDLLDNNRNGAVDDADEFETAPPYNVPLRGIEIRLRVYEPQGKQVRQVTVRHAF